MKLIKHPNHILFGLFCTGALVYVILIRWTLMHALPDPIFTPDSESYLHPVLKVLYQGKFELQNQRTPGYPLFLLSLLGPTHHFWTVLLVQHTLSLITALLAALLFYYFVEKSAVLSLALFLWISLLPQEVAYGQIILTETLYTFLVIVFVGVVWTCLRNPGTRTWIWVGTVTSLAMLTRPVGWTLFMTAVILIFLFHKGRVMWRSFGLFLLPLVMVMGTYITYNHRVRGFDGTDQMGGVVIFDSTARFLDVKEIADTDLRNLLIPVWEKHRHDIEDPNWVYGSKDSPVQVIQNDDRFKKRAMSVMIGLGFQAIKKHPFQFLATQVRLFSYFIYHGSTPYLTPKGAAVQNGLFIFWKASMPFPAARDWLVFTPTTAQAYVDHILHTPAYPYQTTTFLTGPLGVLPETVQFLPGLAICACLILFRCRPFHPLMICLVTLIVTHILLTNLARGVESEVRYAIPIEPLYSLLLITGLSDLPHFCRRFLKG